MLKKNKDIHIIMTNRLRGVFMNSVFMKIKYDDIRNVIDTKLQEAPIKDEYGATYYNFVIANLIDKIEKDSYADFGFSKVLAAYFDIPIDTEVSRVTLEDLNKVNKTMREIEDTINEEVKTNGKIYMTRKDDAFCLMYYELLKQ
jgi:hypothetical protein